MASKPARKTKKRKPKSRASVLQVKSTAKGHVGGLPAGAFLLFGGLCLLMLGWGLWLFFAWMDDLLFVENERFTLSHVEARSDGLLPAAILQGWAGVQEGDNLFEVDIESVRKRIENQPIVRKAVVQRKLPNTLSLVVNERVPIARMGLVDGRMNLLVSEEGIVIKKSFESKHLPFLRGLPPSPVGDDIMNSRAADVLPYLVVLRDKPGKIRDLLPVYEINIGNPDFLDFRFKNGFNIYFPREGDINDLIMQASRAIYEIQNQNKNITFLDMRPTGQNKIGAPE